MGMKKKDRYYLYSFIHILPRKYNIIHNAIFFLSSTSLFIQKGVNSEKNTVYLRKFCVFFCKFKLDHRCGSFD